MVTEDFYAHGNALLLLPPCALVVIGECVGEKGGRDPEV